MNSALLQKTESSPIKKRDRKPRVGFAGLGWIGKSRLDAIAQSGYVDICAMADPNEKALEDCAFDCAKFHTFDRMLQERLDAIVIATPTALHKEQTLKSLNRGMAVFCQKPLGLCAEDIRQMTSAARQVDCLLGVDLSYRYLSSSQDIKQRISAGEIGPVYAVDLVFHNAYGPDKDWFYNYAFSGGGCVIDLGIHLVDLAMWILDWPSVENVSGTVFKGGTRLTSPVKDVEDFASARLEMQNGAVVNMACSWNLSAGCDAVIKAAFYGRKGALRLENINGSFYEFRAIQCFGTKMHLLEHPNDKWYGRAAAMWAKQLAQNGNYNSEIEQMITVAEILDRIYQRQ